MNVNVEKNCFVLGISHNVQLNRHNIYKTCKGQGKHTKHDGRRKKD